MSQDETNPYAPPSTPQPDVAKPESISDAVIGLGEVKFAGAVGPNDLDAYLRVEGHVGCARMALLAIVLGTLLSAFPFMGLTYFAIALGTMGCLLIILTVSTLPYRRLVFININPGWADPLSGHFGTEGIHVRRDFTNTFYRWNWFTEAVESDRVIALLPATQAASPLILTIDMFASADDWERLQVVASALRRRSAEPSQDDAIREENLQILRDQERDWTFTPPQDTIRFEGIVWSDDYNRLPRSAQQRERPMRTHFVIYGLLIFSGLILGGCSGVIFQRVALLPVVVAVYFFAAVAIGRRRQKRIRSVIYYLRGYAGSESLVTDFGLSVGETAWSGLKLEAQDETCLVLLRRNLNNFIVIRRDMIPDDGSWQRLSKMINERTSASD